MTIYNVNCRGARVFQEWYYCLEYDKQFNTMMLQENTTLILCVMNS